MWRSLLVALLVVATVVMAQPRIGFACSCATATPFAGVPDAGHIFHGRVLAIEPTRDGMSHTTFQVNVVWHGAFGSELTITNEDPNRSTCAPYFEIGESYLVRAHDRFGTMFTDQCDGNLRVSLAEVGNRFPEFGPGTPVVSNAPVPDEMPEVAVSEQSEERDDGWLLFASVALLVVTVLAAGLTLLLRRAR